MKTINTIALIISLSTFGAAQNLVPNPSFEKAKLKPKLWMGTYDGFNSASIDWTSPTQASPDLFYVYHMAKYKLKRPHINLDEYKPRTGDFMVGLKVFGCASRTLHCKEYIQVPLKEPLKAGEGYRYEYWLMPVKKSKKVNSFAIAGSMEEIKQRMNSGILDLYPMAVEEEIIDWDENGWQRVAGQFTADNDYKYIIIGNFFNDDIVDFKDDEMEYAYYFIDDIRIQSVNTPTVEKKYEVGSSFSLKDIEFEFDKSILLPSSFSELNELVSEMKKKPNLSIKIQGHTDNVGNQAYNQKLSEQRALSVLTYLHQHGIDKNRMTYKGFGSSQPLVENDSDEHRKRNRRVEIVFGEMK